MHRLEGQRIVVTGAAGGIGSLVVALLVAAGADVLGIDRAETDGCPEMLVADLSDPAALDGVAAALAERHVDTLVNLAGVQAFGPLETLDPATIQLGYTINLVVPALLTQAVLPQMRARRAGQLVNIGSVLGAISYPYFTAYSSAKAGLKSFSEALRRECVGSGITVTHIAPRAVNTGFNTSAVNDFLALAGMRADDPQWVAGRIVQAIARRRKDVSIGAMERFYTRLNALAPRIVDAGLAGQTRKARRLFQI